jgi:general secretion pathway protein D
MTATGILTMAATAKRLRGSVALIAVCAMLTSCAGPISYNDFDTAGGPTKDEYEGLIGRRAPDGVAPGAASSPAAGGEPPIPGFQSVIAAPSAPELADTRRVSIAVTETTPVRDILIELTRKAGVDLEMDPRISGGIIMTATDRPFVEVIERIADLAELRYRMERNTLRVEVDDPYLEQYRMDVLNLTRTSTSTTTSSTDASSVAQALGSAGGGGGSNQSSTNVTMSTTSDFWATIGTNINQILSGIQSRRGAAASAAGAAFVPEAESEAPAAPAQGAKPAAAPAGGGAGGGAGPGAGLVGQAAALTQGRQSVLDQNLAQDLPSSPTLEAAPAAAAAPAASLGSSQFTINPEAGIVTVLATQRQHRAVERYLRDVRNAVTQQILIEAKVVEIALSDQYRAGVDWDAVFGPAGQALTIGTNFSRNVVPPTFSNPTLIANWNNADQDLSLAVQMVKEFGAVRTLSSPRLTALNNQVAQLKVAQNQVFFELDVTFTEATQQGARDKITVASQIKTVPVGFIMSVQPVVDPVTKRISISLRPSITRITGFVNDPGVAVAIGLAQQINPSTPNVSSPIPIIEVRELDSLITMESGQTVVMGGLMQEDVQTTREGLPGVMDIPLVGQAVAQNVKQNKVTELVIFIRATLTNDAGTIADEDIRLYKRFTPDPRPIVF